MRILLIEDNKADVRLTMEALRDFELSGLKVCYDGEEALEYIFKNTVDFILLDLNLPKKNGFTVLEAVRNSTKTRHIPVVILTTSDQQEDVVRAYTLGANGYLTKPIGFENFLKTMKITGDFWFGLAKLPKEDL